MFNEQQAQLRMRMRGHVLNGVPPTSTGWMQAIWDALPPTIERAQCAGRIELDRVYLSEYLLLEPAENAAGIFLELALARAPINGQEALFVQNGIKRVPIVKWDLYRYQHGASE